MKARDLTATITERWVDVSTHGDLAEGYKRLLEINTAREEKVIIEVDTDK